MYLQDEHGDNGVEPAGQRVVHAGVGRQQQGRRMAAGRQLPAGLGSGGLPHAPVSDGLYGCLIMIE